jgi:hypothetical protein
MTQPPILAEIERRRNAAGIIRECLRRHDLQDEVDETNLQVHELYIAEATGNQQRLSRAILDTIFPREAAPCDLYHYTSLQRLRSIASSKELRLYAVRKRLGQGELDTFAKAHGLKGYLDSSQGPPFLEAMSDNLFYASMTRRVPPQNAPLMWGVFAEGTGARVQFRIAPRAAELRSIRYEQRSTKTLLNAINEALLREGLPPFLPWTVSRIIAFYLPSTVQTEDEVRLLIKRYEDGPNPVFSDGTFNYWAVPIGVENDVCRVEIVGIHAAPNAVRADVAAAIKGTAFADVPVTGP